MLRITSHQFAAYLRVEPLPESCEISCRLYWPLIRSQQVNHHWRWLRPTSWRHAPTEKLLQARRNPRRVAALIVNLRLAATLQPYACWRDFTQLSPPLHLPFKD